MTCCRMYHHVSSCDQLLTDIPHFRLIVWIFSWVWQQFATEELQTRGIGANPGWASRAIAPPRIFQGGLCIAQAPPENAEIAPPKNRFQGGLGGAKAPSLAPPVLSLRSSQPDLNMCLISITTPPPPVASILRVQQLAPLVKKVICTHGPGKGMEM